MTTKKKKIRGGSFRPGPDPRRLDPAVMRTFKKRSGDSCSGGEKKEVSAEEMERRKREMMEGGGDVEDSSGSCRTC